MRGWQVALLAGLAATAGCASQPAADPPVAARGAVRVRSAAELRRPDYRLQPGDIVSISVWKEKSLKTNALIGPDGGVSFPLVGDLEAQGRTVDQLREMITTRLQPYIPDAVVSVAIKAIGGNRIYVLGKVNRPGEFPFSRPIDVMQALSLAGGTTPFASLNDIIILHRGGHGVQHALHFHYSAIAHGRDLKQNVLLRSGDTVVVP